MNEANVVTNAADAQRVANAAQLLAEILVREDPRVHAAFDRWQSIMAFLEENTTDPGHALTESFRVVVAVVKDLGPCSEHRWLPRMLIFEFMRRWEAEIAGEHIPPMITLEVPADLPWFSTKPKPKSTARKIGVANEPDPAGARLENLERVIHTWYLCEVREPRVPKKRLAREQGRRYETIKHECHRARWLLGKMDPPGEPGS